ncbi:LOW QUALITY PROTEIN: piggyBac transposable element-derived protein 4-like [Vespula squamosa]|uniref:PiggyBac transposable element-derived protein 4-like n=1 Tax=Vespula squamosa TaxID=30214 RepID=A0ABD2ATE0_VESSQ
MSVENKNAEDFYQILKNDQNVQNTKVALDETVWQQIIKDPTNGTSSHSFKQVSGPTVYAKQNIIFGKTETAFSLIIDNDIVEHIKNVWNRFIENNQNSYKPHMNLIVDEKLFPTKYISSKPHNFSIKFWLTLDTNSKRIFIFGKKRNVTVINTLNTSRICCPQTKLFGVIKENCPKLVKLTKDKMGHFSTVIYKSNNCIVTIYKSKPSKKVIILNSKHKCRENTALNPNPIDSPYKFFFNILHLVGINACVLYKEISGQNILRHNNFYYNYYLKNDLDIRLVNLGHDSQIQKKRKMENL